MGFRIHWWRDQNLDRVPRYFHLPGLRVRPMEPCRCPCFLPHEHPHRTGHCLLLRWSRQGHVLPRCHQPHATTWIHRRTSAINSHFTDSGLFGINVEGPGSHSAELLQVAVEELNRLREPITDSELNRAKNLLKMNVMMALENSGDRLEEIARNFQTFGNLTFQ